MSQQSLNLRRSAQLVRRRKALVGGFVFAGLLLGVGYSVARPPLVSSTSIVVMLPSDTKAPSVATDVVIVGSEPVLSRALPSISPPMALVTLQDRLTVKSLTSSAISISVRGKSDQQAEDGANSVARAYIAYVTGPGSPVGTLAARLLQPATTPTGTAAPVHDATDGILGALVGFLVGALIAIRIGRRKHVLTELDDIANSIGVPVLAALPVGSPTDAPGWMQLLNGYAPRFVEAWWLRQALREVGIAQAAMNGRGTTSITVLSMSSDTRALALGPQLAAYAASLGIPTALFVVQETDTNATAALYTACAASDRVGDPRPSLRTGVGPATSAALPRGTKLAVVVTVADVKRPGMPAIPPTQFAMLGVTAGAGTSEDLAKLASVAASSGSDIAGFLVANPDPADQTTGRIPTRQAEPRGRRQDGFAAPDLSQDPAQPPSAGTRSAG
jgi:capsular polysaccharide biosynthesis protein